MAERSEPRAKSLWAFAVVLVVGALLLPVLYVLSLGPAVWLMDHDCVAPHSIEIYCAPLRMMSNLLPGLHNFVLWYVSFWVD